MDRVSSTVTVLVMLLLAIAVCIRQTIEVREWLGENVATALIAAQVFVGAAIMLSCASMIRNRFLPPTPVRQEHFEPIRHLRRIFSAVWS